ncbi:MAG: two-component system sensor histidine kinase NtrB [Puniceicoccales bacterium]
MRRHQNKGLERILGRLEDLDEKNLTILVNRLVRDRHLLESVFDIIRDGILVLDSESVIQYSNAAAFGLLGLRRREIGHSNIWRRIPELSQALQIDPEGTRSQHRTASCEIEIHYPETRVLQVYLVPLEQATEHDLGEATAVVFSDLTEIKHSTEELIENERIASIMMLSAGVAHELGNPLNSLTIHLQLIRRQLEKLGDSEKMARTAKSLDICTREVDRLDGIITHFLAAVRPQPPDLRKVDPIDVLNDVLEVEENLFSERKITVTIDLDSIAPPIFADPDQLKQVYFNVLKNAVEAMPGGGTIRIRWRKDPRFVTLMFADTGEGIDPEDLAKVFQPYFTTKNTGNGLGMMVVQRIMRDHHGTIAIDSLPEQGTVVTLQFPAINPEQPLLEN